MYFGQIKYILDNCKEDMEFFNTWIDKGIIDRLSVWALSVTIILLAFIWFIPVNVNSNYHVILCLLFCCHYEKDVVGKDVLQISYTEAIDLLSRANKKFEFPVTQ